jgi:hypothetical protein
LPRRVGVFEIGASRNSPRDRVKPRKIYVGVCQDQQKPAQANGF